MGVIAAVAAAVAAVPASATYPYPAGCEGSGPFTWDQCKTAKGDVPYEVAHDGDAEWKFAATPEPGNEPVNSSPQELNGVRGASIVDDDPTADTAWNTTTGRSDVVTATLDSGIRWNDHGDMEDLRKATHLNRGELPVPAHDRTVSLDDPAVLCTSYANAYDANHDGVFNVVDYACDTRVEISPAARQARNPAQPAGVGPADLLDPQDVLIAFTDGVDDDGNGYRDDIVGWDFLDNDNDPFDDVQYGHGTGESLDAAAEADNGGSIAACPNCQVMYTRVGDSFVADVNNFAQATIYATDNGAHIVQEALGAIDNSGLSRQAVEYAYKHGVAIIASAADESAQHHNWPSSLPHTIVVNSVVKYADFGPQAEVPKSYILFNGCTNFSSKITVAIPSKECSSDATGKGAGIAGLIMSAALNAHDKQGAGHLPGNTNCHRTDGSDCVLTPNELRQIMASGTVNDITQADDINFATQPEPSCTPAPTPACTNPDTNAPGNRTFFTPLVPESRRFPSRKGHDQFYGWGRVNALRDVTSVTNVDIPPEAEITSPDWFAQVDPAGATFDVRGQVFARGDQYTCVVEVAPGSYPNNSTTDDAPPGDFKPVSSDQCDGSTTHTDAYDGLLARVDLADLKSRFPANATGFNGREPGIGTTQTSNGRPNIEPYGFIVRVRVTKTQGPKTLTGEDRRNFYLHRDQDTIPNFPIKLPSDGEASPAVADLDGDNRNELILATADGLVHAYKPDGSELPGWPVKTDRLPLHDGDPDSAYGRGEANGDARDAVIGTPAIGDLDHDGTLEVVAADLNGKVYAWSSSGARRLVNEANPAYSGKPLQPFVDVRHGHQNRTQHGFIASPVLADLDGNDGGKLEIIAASMDRHVYAWNDNGTDVPGYPVLVVDHSKVDSIDPQTHRITFKSDIGDDLDQGAIIDTPALANIAGDARPEIIVGTNEEYQANQAQEGPANIGSADAASIAVLTQTGTLEPGNSRLYAIKPEGDADSDPATPSWVDGWPVKVGIILPGILPVVGEGITGSPIAGPVTCPSGGAGRKVGVIPDAGPGLILNPDGTSCYGNDQDGRYVAMQTDAPSGNGRYDTPSFPALGHPAFGNLGEGISFLAPTIGLKRALDLQAEEYQPGQDFLGIWNSSTGQFRPGFPAPVNDLQFLTGPSVADIDGVPGEEAIEGTASLDLQAFNAGGTPAGANWPKLMGDWMVANPLIGSFGTLDTDSASHKKVFAVTRSGYVLAYDTTAPACSPGSWPRFHHDNANSGDYERDAVSPGVPYGAAVAGGNLTWKAPGDDLLCGTATKYEMRQSDSPIGPGDFDQVDELPSPPTPVAAGGDQTYTLPAGVKRYVAVRAADDQGNVGRPMLVDTQAPVAPGDTPGDKTTPPGSSPDAGSGGPAPTGANPPGGGAQAKRGCTFPARAALGRTSLGKAHVGDTFTAVLKKLGTPTRAKQGVFRYCVKNGGRVLVAFDRLGRARMVASTARRHAAKGVKPGSSVKTLLLRFRVTRRYGSVLVAGGRLFGTRAGKVSWIAAADPTVLRSQRQLRAYKRALRLR